MNEADLMRAVVMCIMPNITGKVYKSVNPWLWAMVNLTCIMHSQAGNNQLKYVMNTPTKQTTPCDQDQQEMTVEEQPHLALKAQKH